MQSMELTVASALGARDQLLEERNALEQRLSRQVGLVVIVGTRGQVGARRGGAVTAGGACCRIGDKRGLGAGGGQVRAMRISE